MSGEPSCDPGHTWGLEPCDRTHNPIFPLDQQGQLLLNNPLDGQRDAYSGNQRFARTDVWVRDIRQVIDDAVARAQPSNGQVTLVGNSLGALHVGRTLYAANPVLPGGADTIAKVDRAVFLSPFFFPAGPTEETTPHGGFADFPLSLVTKEAAAGGWQMPPGRDAACTGHTVPGSIDRMWAQVMEQGELGSTWGGPDPAYPVGFDRTPAFNSYGWNSRVAGELTPPTLVVQGLEDTAVPGGPGASTALYNAPPAAMTNKILVQVRCASHAMIAEGCSGPRCTPASGTPYGTPPGEPWPGPYATARAALVEWITGGDLRRYGEREVPCRRERGGQPPTLRVR